MEIQEILLTPRFYTTNFKKISVLDISSNANELNAIIKELKIDYNRDHFIRDREFSKRWGYLDIKVKKLFIKFLERSCIAEFSGFLLYKEIARNLKKTNPLLAQGFSYMARDEARHAGFLNKAMSDFNIFLDLGFLTKTRKYTFFDPKFIFYTIYLSEKIGYWKYITIYRYLEKNPDYRIYPIFRFFENWCQDENRHGDFFAALLKSQKHLLNTYESKLWCKFFLIIIYTTLYLNDNQKKNFYFTIGLNIKQFNQHVIRKTNQSTKALFPIILDVDHPKFFFLLDECSNLNQNLYTIDEEKNCIKFIKTIKKLPSYFGILVSLVKLYFLPTIKTKHIWTKN